VSLSYSSLTVQCGLKPHSMPPPTNQPLLVPDPFQTVPGRFKVALRRQKSRKHLIFEPLGRCNIQQRRFLRHAQPEFPAGFFLLVPHTRKEREI
jgi:hypothetical protein